MGRSSSRFFNPLATIRNPAAHVVDIPTASCIDSIAIIASLPIGK